MLSKLSRSLSKARKPQRITSESVQKVKNLDNLLSLTRNQEYIDGMKQTTLELEELTLRWQQSDGEKEGRFLRISLR